MGATHLMISLTMTDAPTHGLPGHAGVGAGVVGLVTNGQTVLVRIIATHSHCGVTWRGLGQLPTFSIFPAAVVFIIVGIDFSVRSAVTGSTPAYALIPAHGSLSVVAGVIVPEGRGRGVTQVSRPQSHKQQQRGN